QSGYDTHASQGFVHANLLTEFGGAVEAFLADLTAAKLAERVSLLAFSEFGRTIAENASGGTDHGTAAPVFVAGPAVVAGLIGAMPSLTSLQDGEPRMTTDFRRVYATIRENWLGLPAAVPADVGLVVAVVEPLRQGHAPPFGGLHDIRLTVRRAQIWAMLAAEQLLEIAETLACTGAMYRYRMRLDSRLTRLIELLTPIEDLGLVGKTINGCIDGRGQVLDSASPELARLRRPLAELDGRARNQLKRL